MRKITSFLAYSLLLINAVLAVLFLLSAYSSYINPAKHPLLSCIGLPFPILLAIMCLSFIFWLFIKARFSLLPLLALLAATPQIMTYAPVNSNSDIPQNYPIKVLSYNAMSLAGVYNNPAGNPMLSYIIKSKANIACIQEYNSSVAGRGENKKQQNQLYKLYPYHLATKIGKQDGANGMAIFSTYPILSSRKIAIDSQYNGAMIYKLSIGADTLYVINCHLESNKLVLEDKVIYEEMLKDPNAEKFKDGLPHLVKKLGEAAAIRAQQANIISREIAQVPPNSYVLVCGDFNDTPISYTHRVISQNMKDAFVESGNGLGISYNQHKLYFRIDHILTSKNISSYDCEVDRSIKDSDHYPISCVITLDPK